ncbi:uncharacterized protein [Dermacentor andersoni]|uniref:uncharacterized protein isoform X1 n=2 Tax=Dermacentor andersoni TaxID=34620 RepID=UPI002415C249|nr:uncharacterized protein LOC126537703 isoform X1 [Dermacentor andersoni]
MRSDSPLLSAVGGLIKMGSLLMVIGNLGFFIVVAQGGSADNITRQAKPANVSTSTSFAAATLAQQGGSTDNATLQAKPANVSTSTRLPAATLAQQTATTTVNITANALAFIQELNRTWHDIISWGITPHYAYWTGQHNLSGEHPIHAHAGEFNCSKILYDYSDADVKLARLVWYIPQKICSPVKIKVNVTLPLYTKKGFKEKNITLNFNNRKIIVRRSPRRKKVRTEGLDKVIEMCPFTVNVTFHGWFAYETADPESGNRFYSVGVGVLHDKPKGLIRQKHNRLSYLIRGWFKRITYWKNGDT